jgi:small subunit ribosomal protein S11
MIPLGYEAGYQCALRIFSRIGELKKTVNPALGDLKIELLFNGMLGQGREAVYRALMTQDGELRAHKKTSPSDETDFYYDSR